jgi:predicted RNA binding protein YcfA (HicA-like mRNA interferase family)
MKAISGKDFAKVLEQHGWELLRTKGSHHIYGKVGKEIRISIPIHGNHTLETGLLRHFIRLAGLTERDLL